VVVRPEDVEAQRPAARAALRAAGLDECLRAAAPGPYGLTRTALDLLEGLETATAAGLGAEKTLDARIARDRAAGFASGEPTERERLFAAALGVLVAAEEALGATDPGSDAALPDRPFEPNDVAAILSAENGRWAEDLARDVRGYVEHYSTHPDAARRLGDEARLAACVRSHWRKMALAARAALDAAEHAPLREALTAATLRLPGVDYAGLDRRAASDGEPPELLDVDLDDVVGNHDVVQAAVKLARSIASFDIATRRNPRAVDNPVLFILGSPGCGKTVTAHAVGRYFLRVCAEAGVPARFRVIRRTDWASHYQNKSASDLLRIFREEVFGFHGVCGAYWPDIDTAFAARGDPDIRSEEKANLATLFGILDGTVGPRNGQWFLICDANYMQMDEALASRLTQDPKIARGPETGADYVRLLRDVKLKGWRDLLPDDEAWTAIGARLEDARLSGRAVAAIAGRLIAEIQDVAEPPGFLAMSFDEKRAALRAAARPASAERIAEEIERYVRFEREAEGRAHRERFDRRVDEIRLQLSASAAALGTTPAS
jgi:hypothetical protein